MEKKIEANSPKKKFSLNQVPVIFTLDFRVFKPVKFSNSWGSCLPDKVSTTAIFPAKVPPRVSEFKDQFMMTALVCQMIMERFFSKEPIYHIFNILHLYLWNKSVSADLDFLGRSVLLIDLVVAELWACVRGAVYLANNSLKDSFL